MKKPLPNVEELAAQARQQRQEDCLNAIHAVLTKHNCHMALQVNVGTETKMLRDVFLLPVVVSIASN